MGVPAAGVPAGLDAQVALYRSLLAGTRMFLVLDNPQTKSSSGRCCPGYPGVSCSSPAVPR